ncbi:MAG: hypothetical protein WD768_20590 [Phycisphaeraceae bacterium]
MTMTASNLISPRGAPAATKPQPRRNKVTPEGRQKLRETALKHRPWTRSTGPRTAAGKAKVALNGLKRQKVPGPSVRQLRREMAGACSMMNQLAELRRLIAV